MDFEIQIEVFEVSLHLPAVKSKDILICHGKNSAPFAIAVGQLRIGNVKNSINKSEIVLDLLIALDMKAGFGLMNGCFEV